MRLRPELRDFLAAAFPDARVVPIAGDASTRSFFRISPQDGPSLVAMDYGAAFQGDTDDVRLTRVFEAARLPVPRIVRIAPEAGCLILEDLGDGTLESALAQSGEPRRLYRTAVQLAVAVAVQGTPALVRSDRAQGPALDLERFRFEMDFFVQHYVRGLQGVPDPDAALVVELHALADRAASGKRVLCHRDFHSRNLMVRPDGSLAMVDIQDARWGPDTYDLASLLRDAYVDTPDTLIDEMVELHCGSLPDGSSDPPAVFRQRFELVCAQRMIKALGTFGYQTKVMGKVRYLTAIPRTLRRLAVLLPVHPETAALARILDRAGLLAPPSGV